MCLNGFGGLKRMTELCKTRLPEGFPVADVAVYKSEDKKGSVCTWLKTGALW